MRHKNLILSILGVVMPAFGAGTIWLGELLLQSDRLGQGWLWTSQYAIFGVIFCAVLAYLLPVRLLKQIPWNRLWMPGLELYFVAVIAFFLSKSILYSLFLPISVFDLPPYILWLMLGTLVLTTAGSFYYLTRNYLYPVKILFIPAMIGVQLLAPALAFLTAYWFAELKEWETILTASVKMGIPFFYFTLLLGLFSILSIKKLVQEEVREDQEEILDDVEFPG